MRMKRRMRNLERAFPLVTLPWRAVRHGRSAAESIGESRSYTVALSLALGCGALAGSVWGTGGEGPAGATNATVVTHRSLVSVSVPTAVALEEARAASDPTAGLSLAFNPHFRGTRLNTSTWSTCYPAHECNNYGNSNEVEWYRPSGALVSGGTLHLVATQTPTKGTDASGAPKTYPYRSGMVTTKNSFAFTYGYVQVVAQIPATAGTWPALWLLPKAVKWPPEIDIMENFGNTTSISTTYHWGTTKDPKQKYRVVQTGADLGVGYHTYGLLWKPGSLTWYFDGKVVFTYTGSAVPSQAMYFLANLAIDGPAASGSSFNIRSVKIYT